MPSKTTKLKLLAALNPTKRADFLMQILKEDIKNIEKKIPAVKDYSGSITEIENELGLLKILQESINEKISKLPPVYSDANLIKKLDTLFVKVDSEKEVYNSEITQLRIDADKEIKKLVKELANLKLTSLKHGGGSMYPSIKDSFETVYRNLQAYPYTATYSGTNLATKTFAVPGGTITATYSYTGTNLTSIVLSGNTPAGISKTKTLTYSGNNVSSVSYA